MRAFLDSINMQRREPDGSWSEVTSVPCRKIHYRSAAYLPMGLDVAAGDVAVFPDAERFEVTDVIVYAFSQRVELRSLRK